MGMLSKIGKAVSKVSKIGQKVAPVTKATKTVAKVETKKLPSGSMLTGMGDKVKQAQAKKATTAAGVAGLGATTVPSMKKGGKTKCMAKGGGIEVRGKTRGRFI